MARSRPRRSAAWLAVWLAASAVAPAFAQNKAVPVVSFDAPVTPVVRVTGAGAGNSAAVAPLNSSLSSALNGSSFVPAAGGPVAAAPAPVAAARLVPAARAASVVPLAGAPEDAEKPVILLPNGSVSAAVRGVRTDGSRETAAVATVAGGVAAWGAERSPEKISADAPSAGLSLQAQTLAPSDASGRASDAAIAAVPAPAASAHPRAARAAFIGGAVLVGAAAVSFAFPALIPAAVAAYKGYLLYAGFALMGQSRYWRNPGTTVASPRGPPAAGAAETGASNQPAGIVKRMARGGWNQIQSIWSKARAGAESQVPLESRVGGSSLKSVRDWLLGALRAALAWFPVAVATMGAGWALARPFARFGNPDGEGLIPFDSLAKFSFGGHLLGFVAGMMATQAVVLAVFDGVRALSRRLGAGRASDFIGGAAALALSAAVILSVTTMPSVLGTALGIQVALLWLRARSNSWAAPLMLSGILSMVSLQSARTAIRFFMGASGVMVGLPAIWAGVAVAGILFAGLAWSAGSLRPAALWGALKSQLARVKEFGAAWRAPTPDGAPHSPWPLLKLAALGGMALYASGDLLYSGLRLFGGGAEPTPNFLHVILSAPIDIVLFNLLLAGPIEEFVFRRGIFKGLTNLLTKFSAKFAKWGLTPRKIFWIAALASSMVFSITHSIDLTGVMAHLGLVDPATAASFGGVYTFTWAGFITRTALGVALAGLYAMSGTLVLPILVHSIADAFEGLGIHLGMWPFMAISAAIMLLQRTWKNRKAATPS